MASLLRLPPGMTRPNIPPNPNAGLITHEMWEFACCVVSLEPNDFANAGIYADKSGYHNTVTRNLARWPGEYSSRLALDLNGVRDKARAFDCTSRSAQAGNYAIMAKRGARMRAAAKARDPRVRHWREVLGQFDTDGPPEAIDFQSLGERQPDDTHRWHFHWSILAMYVRLALAYEGMLSVLYGESLESWTRYELTGDDDMVAIGDKATMLNYVGDPRIPQETNTLGGYWMGSYYYARRANADTVELKAMVSKLNTTVSTLVDFINQSGGDVDTAGVIARMNELAAAEVARETELLDRIAELETELVSAHEAIEANLSPAERAAIDAAGQAPGGS